MLALEMRFLTGRYVATCYNDRQRAEWPPHPARVYSALVAALYDHPSPPDDERTAVKWLATAGAPEILGSEAGFRRQSEVYVPTNDPAALASIDSYIEKLEDAETAASKMTGKGRASADKAVEKAHDALVKRSLKTSEADGKGTPSNAGEVANTVHWHREKDEIKWTNGRSRQPRTFPMALPHRDLVVMLWSEEAPKGVANALDRVAARVARLGHSSSLVSMRVTDGRRESEQEGLERWRTSDEGDHMLRVPADGQLERLEDAHALHRQVEPRVLPAAHVAYSHREPRPPRDDVAGAVFASSGWLVFRVVPPPEGGTRTLLHLSLAQQVARAMRNTLRSVVNGDLPEELLGHASGGGPSAKPHLAIVPLADVGHPHASGSILGIALVPPAGLDAYVRGDLLRAVGLTEAEAADDQSDPSGGLPVLKLKMGRAGCLYLQRLQEGSQTMTLQPARWTRIARRWSSVTAITLDRNPGNLRSRDPEVISRALASAEGTIAAACVHVGLPEPQAVWIHQRSVTDGAPAAERFMPYPSDDRGPRRVCVHAEVLFAEPVRGPVLLGAGRYLGIGLCIAHGRV